MTDGAAIVSILQRSGRRVGVEVSGETGLALFRFARLLEVWNARVNLSGARDLETLAREHLADALALVPHLPGQGTCIDVGSGGGLPGVVLATLRRDLQFVLLEPSQKRAAFLAAAARELCLANVSLCRDRLDEHLAKASGRYDFAVARAVFPLDVWLEKGAGLLRTGGTLIGLAGGDLPDPAPGAVAIRYDVGAGPRTIVRVRPE